MRRAEDGTGIEEAVRTHMYCKWLEKGSRKCTSGSRAWGLARAVVSRGLAHPPCRPVGTCRHLSPPVDTICRWSPCGAPSYSALPAAQAVIPRTVARGHQAGWSIGTEHALCQTSISALQQVAWSVMPYGCSRDLVLQTCAMRSRPARSCRSHTRGRQMACREEAHMDETRRLAPSSASQACGTRSQRGGGKGLWNSSPPCSLVLQL